MTRLMIQVLIFPKKATTKKAMEAYLIYLAIAKECATTGVVEGIITIAHPDGSITYDKKE